MRLHKLFIAVWLAILNVSCVMSSVEVIREYDPEVNFTVLKSYDWFPVPENNISYGLIVKQIMSEMNDQLKSRGFNKDSQHPDFLIALHGGIQNRLSFPEWEYLGEKYKNYAITRRFDIANYTDDTFIIDIIDTGTNTLVYRATATVYLSIEPTSEKREKKIAEAVKEILDDYTQVIKHEKS